MVTACLRQRLRILPIRVQGKLEFTGSARFKVRIRTPPKSRRSWITTRGVTETGPRDQFLEIPVHRAIVTMLTNRSGAINHITNKARRSSEKCEAGS